MYHTRGERVYIASEGEEDLFDKSFRIEKRMNVI